MKKYLSVAAVSLVVLCTACQPSNKSEKSENTEHPMGRGSNRPRPSAHTLYHSYSHEARDCNN